MTLVDYHQIVLIDRRDVARLIGEQDASHQPLNGADAYLGRCVWRRVGELLSPKMSANV